MELFNKYDTETGKDILSEILESDIELFLRDKVITDNYGAIL